MAGAGAATARSLCPGDLEVVDVVEGSPARASITWVAVQGFPWVDVMAVEDTEAGWLALVEDTEAD